MKITANGNNKLNNGSRPSSTYYVSGALGAATVTFTHKNSEGNFIPLIDGTVEINAQYLIHHGSTPEIYLTVSGADGSTAIIIERVEHR